MPTMKRKRQTQPHSNKIRPEAELESRLTTALITAFPNIPREQLSEQRYFTVRLGRETHDFDSAEQWKKSGRADVIIFHDGRPLAVIELKREDLALTVTDYEQAQSYANQLTPRPPLVVVTNGSDTRIYDAQSGQPWSGEQDAAAAVAKLFSNSAKLAAADMRWAVAALMGRETGVWVHGVRAATARLLEDMTDPPGQTCRPFAENLLFPRDTTLEAIKAAQDGTAFVIVEGTPQSGKSSCLRELSLKTTQDEELAVLMLRGAGPGLFQSLANLFAAEFEWNLTANDARQWLRRMSHETGGPSLVLAIDDVEPCTQMASDLEELAGLLSGSKLVVILTTDRAEPLVKSSNGRSQTAMGARAKVIETAPLSLNEFEQALYILKELKIFFQNGAEYSDDYRAPWVLRTIYDGAAREPEYQKPERALFVPPAPGLELVDVARECYADQYELLRNYRVLARCAIADTNAHSSELTFAALNGFVVRQDALTDEARYAVKELKRIGAARTFRLAGQEDVVVPTIPAAFLLELSDAVADELARLADDDPLEAGVWLGKRLEAINLGDMVGAQALRRYAQNAGTFNFQIIEALIRNEPVKKPFTKGLLAMAGSEGQLIHLKFDEGKAWLSNAAGIVLGEAIDLGDEHPLVHSEVISWMILAQLAKCPFVADSDGNLRLDAAILLHIGKCPFPLLRTNKNELPYLEHEFGELGQVLCHEKAAVEVATQAMADLLSSPWQDVNEWVDAVIKSNSFPLMHRLSVALTTVRLREIPEISDWANKTLKERVNPVITAALQALCDTEEVSEN